MYTKSFSPRWPVYFSSLFKPSFNQSVYLVEAGRLLGGLRGTLAGWGLHTGFGSDPPLAILTFKYGGKNWRENTAGYRRGLQIY